MTARNLYHGTPTPWNDAPRTPTGRDGWSVVDGEVLYLTDALDEAQRYAGSTGVVYCVDAPHALPVAVVRQNQSLSKKRGRWVRGVYVTPPSLVRNWELLGANQ